MVFSSFLFLFLFFPVVCVIYFLAPRIFKNTVLLLASALFYGWGAPQVLPFLVLGCAFDFFVGRWIVPGRLDERIRRWVFGSAVVLNLAALLYYKYANFFVAEAGRFLSQWGFALPYWTPVMLPLGISFFTFHKISYLGDIFRGKVRPSSSLIDYSLYILFFPQLIAGPIIRYADVSSQFKERRSSLEGTFEGLVRFCRGLGKKVLIADSLGNVTDTLLGMPLTSLSTSTAWLAMVCYSFQIYFDFSGYSDMAIGLARIFGFRFLENFNRPYIARTFTDFWRRWHISLSNFMREYVYIPLGGNRKGAFRTHLNLWITFLLSGLWHGASWNFVIWGMYHGMFLTLDRIRGERIAKAMPNMVMVAITFLLVTIGWVFFRLESLPDAGLVLRAMAGLGESSMPSFPRALIIDNRSIAALIAAAVISFWPLRSSFHTAEESPAASPVWLIGSAGGALVMLLLSTASLASRGYTPFLYFKF